MKSLLEVDKFNYIIVHKNNHTELENCLSGERLERYEQANRDITKDKLLSGSYFVYRSLKALGFSSEICQAAFSTKSSYLINLPKGQLSYSNSGEYHVLTFSQTDTTGVDMEEYRDRPERTYQRFLELPENFKGDLKSLFYQKWLEKEILYKQNQAKSINYFSLENYLCGYSFSSQKKVRFIRLLDLLADEFEEMDFPTMENLLHTDAVANK